jgi:hypothetical protein
MDLGIALTAGAVSIEGFTDASVLKLYETDRGEAAPSAVGNSTPAARR